MTIEWPNGWRTRTYPRAAALAIVAIISVTSTVQSQELGRVEGELKVNGKPVELNYSYVYTEEHPFNEGEYGTVIKLTTEEVPYRELDSPFSGGSTLSVSFDAQGEVYSRNLFLRTSEGSQSVSGLDFEFSLEQSGPDEYRGTIQGTIEYFDDQFELSLKFAAAPLAETGTPLPPHGGEPGKAYVAHFEVMSSGDMDKIRKMVPQEALDDMKEMGLSEEEVLEFITMSTPSEVEIVGGTLDGDTAYLEVKMVMDGQPGTGTITMEKEDDRWVLVSELWKQ